MTDSTVALKKTKKQLHESGSKLTSQRKATVLVLLENEKDHLSVEETYSLAKQKSPEIGLATAHRTLEILTGLEVVGKMSFNDGLVYYGLGKESTKHLHHHLLCLECGTIEEVEEDLLGEVEQIVESRYHLSAKDHRLASHGIYQGC